MQHAVKLMHGQYIIFTCVLSDCPLSVLVMVPYPSLFTTHTHTHTHTHVESALRFNSSHAGSKVINLFPVGEREGLGTRLICTLTY